MQAAGASAEQLQPVLDTVLEALRDEPSNVLAQLASGFVPQQPQPCTATQPQPQTVLVHQRTTDSAARRQGRGASHEQLLLDSVGKILGEPSTQRQLLGVVMSALEQPETQRQLLGVVMAAVEEPETQKVLLDRAAQTLRRGLAEHADSAGTALNAWVFTSAATAVYLGLVSETLLCATGWAFFCGFSLPAELWMQLPAHTLRCAAAWTVCAGWCPKTHHLLLAATTASSNDSNSDGGRGGGRHSGAAAVGIEGAALVVERVLAALRDRCAVVGRVFFPPCMSPQKSIALRPIRLGRVSQLCVPVCAVCSLGGESLIIVDGCPARCCQLLSPALAVAVPRRAECGLRGARYRGAGPARRGPRVREPHRARPRTCSRSFPRRPADCRRPCVSHNA
jgi:hypothetical protein